MNMCRLGPLCAVLCLALLPTAGSLSHSFKHKLCYVHCQGRDWVGWLSLPLPRSHWPSYMLHS